MKEFLRHDYDDIGRMYIFNDNSIYYSATTALGFTADKSFLIEWANRVGKKKAEAITKYAGEIGTQVHDALEHYMLGDGLHAPNSVSQNLAKQITPYIDKRVGQVYHTEKVLYSDRLKLAGTVDGVVSYMINGAYHTIILDFKTAKRQPKMEWIQDYILQLAIYAIMMEEMYGNSIDYGVLLFAYKEKRSPMREIPVNLKPYKPRAIQRIKRFHEAVKKNKRQNHT